MATVKAADAVLSTMKRNLASTRELLEEWNTPLIQRKAKPETPDDFAAQHQNLVLARVDAFKKGSKKIHDFIRSSNQVLRVSQGLPDWRSYVAFVNNIVTVGLSDITCTSLEYLLNQIDPVRIEGS